MRERWYLPVGSGGGGGFCGLLVGVDDMNEVIRGWEGDGERAFLVFFGLAVVGVNTRSTSSYNTVLDDRRRGE